MEASNKSAGDGDRNKALPTEENLLGYAKAYMAAYMEVIEREHPENLPPFAKNAPYDIEVAMLPNGCFAILYQKSNKESIIATDRDWNYVEGKVVSGVDHIVSVYQHEGISAEDAAAKGRKDATNDIRSMAGNEIVQASLHLEQIVDELTNVAMANRASLKSIATQISKLTPIKDAAKKGFPQSDMLRMIQSMKNYPAAPVEITLDIPDRDLLEKVSGQLTDTSELVRRIEGQEDLIEDLEDRIKKSYDELQSKIDEKMDHGLALVLTASDRKIDKGLATITEAAKSGTGVSDDRVKTIVSQMEQLKMDVAAAMAKADKSPVAEKIQETVSSELANTREKINDLSVRIEAIEDYLMKISEALRKRA